MNDAQIRRPYALLACLVLFLLLVLAAVSASAAVEPEDIGFELTLDPVSLTAPGEVTASVRVTNLGGADISEPLSLFDADGKLLAQAFDGGSLFPLKAGEFRTWQGKWYVSQGHLDAGKVEFALRYNSAGADGSVSPISIPASADIAFAGEKIGLGVTRRIDPEVVRTGSAVTVLYELVNSGNVRLTDITVRENSSIASRTQRADDLLPGASATVSFKKTAASADLESSAAITYYKEGSRDRLQVTVEAQKIPIAKPRLSIDLSVDKPSVNVGEAVELTLTLNNEGNISYSNVRVTDAKLGEVFTNLEIPAGQKVVRTKTVTMTEPAAFLFTVALEDNTGTSKTEKTNELKVSAYDEGQMMRLNLQLSADRTSIDSLPGFIRFTVLVTNDSNAVAKNVSILHGNTLIYTISALAPGQSVPVTREYTVSQAGKFRFSAQTKDALDNQVSFHSNELAIPYVPATPSPTRPVIVTLAPVVTFTPVPPDAADPIASQGRNALFIIALALGGLFAVSFVLFAISSVIRLNARRQSNAAYDHLEIEPKRDFTDPDTYEPGEKRLVPDEEERATGSDATKQPDPFPDEELPHHKYLKDEQPRPESLVSGPKDAKGAEAAPDGKPQQLEEDTGYRLFRDAQDDADAAGSARRSRRSDKHNGTAPGEDA